MEGMNQQLFDHMLEEHGLTLLQSEMHEIIQVVKDEQGLITRDKIEHLLIQYQDLLNDAKYAMEINAYQGFIIALQALLIQD